MKIHIFLIFIIYFSTTQSAENQKNHTATKDIAYVNIITEEKGESRSVKKELDTAKGLVESKNPVQNNATNESGKNTHLTDTSYKSPEVESGAMIRGVLVFVGIGLLFITYLGCKTYYRKKKPTVAIIKKYGVRTKRSDLEMEPLPLDEDDEDETLFDVKNINRT